jgi:N-acetylglucosamine kinase-like BadF-type ATPase
LGVDVVVGVDGGNSKTELLAVATDGAPVAYVRGPGSNSHGRGGVQACVDVVARLVEAARLEAPAAHGAFFLCGADVPADVAALTAALEARRLVGRVAVANDTFALLRAGSDAPDAVAVVCGSGINSAGRSARGQVARYPALGWETGDWGGADALGREALFHAARAEDGRGEATVLVEVVRDRFGTASAAAAGEEVHYGRVSERRLGELAPAVVAAAAADEVAAGLVQRVAGEVVLLAWKALRDLDLLERPVDVVLGGGMLRGGVGPLHDAVVAGLAARAPYARPLVAEEAPVLGAALAALDAVGAPADAGRRLRAAFADGAVAEVLP